MRFSAVILLICLTLKVNAVAAFNNAINMELSFNYTLTTPLLHPPYVSGAIGDVTDPAATLGFYINVTNNKSPLLAADYEAMADIKESNLVKEDIHFTKQDGLLLVKIAAAKQGINTFNIVVAYKGYTESIEVNYAASMPSKQGGYWHTGISDASAAIDVGNGCMLVADDEMNTLNVYAYQKSGLPIKTFAYGDKMHLQDMKDGEYREIDCEAAAISPVNPNIVYWLGSMSNGGKEFETKVNRSSLFATIISGVGEQVDVSYSHNYHDLRNEVIKWGNAHGYKLSAAAEDGHSAKTIDGFNMEGACFAPDGTTLYLCFRAPLVPVDSRTKALVIPVLNFESWFNNGKPENPIAFAEPIELNLSGRGIRDVFPLPNKKYMIVAGASDGAKSTTLFVWSGQSNEQPVEIKDLSLAEMPVECGFSLLHNGAFNNEVVLITDSGSQDYYASGSAAKNLHPNLRKFNTVILKLPDDVVSR